MLKILFAFLLITDSTIPTPKELPKEINQVAVSLEIMDKGEYLGSESSKLFVLRERYRTIKNAPKAWEINRFPSSRASVDGIHANNDYGDYIEVAGLLHWKASKLMTVREENAQLRRIWFSLYHAHSSSSVFEVRLHLLQLKESIGNEQFYLGQMPPPVPVWRFVMAK
jgi:hypothetical protein